MAAHTDRKELGPVVWGITITGTGHLAFTRPGAEDTVVPTNEGSAYCMTGESRYAWAHQPFGLDRLSITLRAVPDSNPSPSLLRTLGVGRKELELAAQAQAVTDGKHLRKAIMKVGKKLSEIQTLQ